MNEQQPFPRDVTSPGPDQQLGPRSDRPVSGGGSRYTFVPAPPDVVTKIVRWIQKRAAEYERMERIDPSMKRATEKGWPETLLHNIANEIATTFGTAVLAAPAPEADAAESEADGDAMYAALASVAKALGLTVWGIEELAPEVVRRLSATEADAAGEAWTEKPPTRSGYYWHRDLSEDIHESIVEVAKINDHFRVYTTGSGEFEFLADVPGEWSGPLAEPK